MDQKRILASLIVYDETGKETKMQIRNQSGTIKDTIDLAMLDYLLASYSSLENYLEAAVRNGWISSKNVTLKIVGTDGTIYPLPFETVYNDIIFKASECAMARGNSLYIENGTGNRMVDSSEFSVFFKDFLDSVLSEEGFTLVKNDYFKDYPTFHSLIKKYHDLLQKEDDMFAQAEANQLEKKSFAGKEISNPKTPTTINDFLRYYPIFRRAISFNIKCLQNRNHKILEENRKQEKWKNKENKSYEQKRSLCYLIGNNCAPLILRTMPAYALDTYIRNHYTDPKEIREENKELIESYIASHMDYIKKIRSLVSDPSYSGQLTILEHNMDGTFRRLPNGSYLRYPILYTKVFERVRNLYCNIDKFRLEAQRSRDRLKRIDERIHSTRAQMVYDELEEKLRTVLSDLEKEKRITTENRKQTMISLQRIVYDMQKLEKEDRVEVQNNPSHHRLFSEHASRIIRFIKASSIHKREVVAIDEWGEAMESSPYYYDSVRFILRTLRYKQKGKKQKNVVSTQTDCMHIEKPKEEVIEKDPESILYPSELAQMYGNDIPKEEELEKRGIHVSK